MPTYKNINDVIQHHRDNATSYANQIAAWEGVTIKTKKNGDEFAELSNRCIDGARIQTEDWNGEKRMYVYTKDGGRYESYNLDCYGFCDELPEEDPRSERAKTQGFIRAYYDLTPAEMRQQISDHIEKLTGWKENEEHTAEWFSANREMIEKDVETIKEHLHPLAKFDTCCTWHLSEAIAHMIK